MKLLVIDDSQVNLKVYRSMISKLLPDAEYRATAAPEEGLELARQWQPDVILMDYHMPGMDGMEATRRLKSDPLTSPIPVIMLTAQQTTPALRIKALELGADAFLQKPVDGAELIAQVKVMLRIRQAEAHLRHSQKMEAIGTLAGGVAHDFNNILTVILGYGSMLQLQLPSDSPYSEAVSMIVNSAKRASALTQRLLAFSRKQENHKSIEPLCELLKNFEKFLKRVIGEDISLSISCDGGPISVSIDRNLLEQVLMNLAANARDAMPHGGHMLIKLDRVTVESDQTTELNISSGQYARIIFHDTGTGIPEEIRSRIFDPFFTTKEIGKGSGLGLPMVYGIIRQHGGAITVDSVIDKGTSFTILLPIGSDLADEQLAPPDIMRGDNETVLLVEDEPSVRATTAAILEQFGYKVIQAADGNQALHLFSEQADQIRLVMMDMIMPGLNGWDTAELIHKQRPELPVLFVSGYTDDLITSKGINLSQINLLTKPVPTEDLLRAIHKLLERNLSKVS